MAHRNRETCEGLLYYAGKLLHTVLMLTTIHVLTGAVIGQAIKRPVVSSAMSFAVHYALDAVPHWSWKPVKRLKEEGWRNASKRDIAMKSVEPLLGVLAASYMLYRSPRVLTSSIVSGIVFGWLPDLLVFLEWKAGISRPRLIKDFETKIHRHDYTWRGLAPQFMMAVAAVAAHQILYKKTA